MKTEKQLPKTRDLVNVQRPANLSIPLELFHVLSQHNPKLQHILLGFQLTSTKYCMIGNPITFKVKLRSFLFNSFTESTRQLLATHSSICLIDTDR